MRQLKDAVDQLVIGFGGFLQSFGGFPRFLGIFMLGNRIFSHGCLSFTRSLFFFLESFILFFPILEFLAAGRKFIGSKGTSQPADDHADSRANAGCRQSASYCPRSRADQESIHNGVPTAVSGQRSHIAQRFFDGFRVDADIIQRVGHAAQHIHSRLSEGPDNAGQFLNAVFIVMDTINQILKTSNNIRHQILSHRQKSRTKRQLELPCLHFHLAPFKIGLMSFLRIQQSRGLDMRCNFHEIIILF